MKWEIVLAFRLTIKGSFRYVGALGYWLCTTLYSELFVAYGMYGSRTNLGAITVERYLKVVHSVWSKKKLRSWMTHSAMAFSWLIGPVVLTSILFITSGVKDGVCSDFGFASKEMAMAYMIWHFLSFYVMIFAIFIFCYGRILVVIRRQAKVMATHSGAGSTTSQSQSNQIQTNVVHAL